MLFNSYIFIFIFLPIVFIVYFYLNSRRLVVASKAFLVFSSLFFYSWWDIKYLPIILASLLFNYVIGNILSKKIKSKSFSKKAVLSFGIISNLSLLAYFKYADFFIENFNFSMNNNIELLQLTLPLAISFFTFQQIAYLVDSYKGETKEYDFLNYTLFVTFFPQLIAGPIVHHKEMMPQFEMSRNKVKSYKNIATGLFIFSLGLFKKVVIADSLAKMATQGFDVTEKLTMIEAWVTSLSYTFQLYFDFSGYADMAIGIALLFNIKLPINFNSPYKALSIQDFWRRWHMTLSRFLRDYIYIPLGGNKKGTYRIYTNLMTTFLLGGFWHGAGWTFIFWGFLHGLALSVHRIWSSFGYKMNRLLAWFITFNFVNVTWVFFRANEWEDAIKVLKAMFVYEDFSITLFRAKFILMNIGGNDRLLITLVISMIVAFFFSNTMEIRDKFKVSYKNMVVFVILSTIALLELNKVSEFLYFNF